MLSAILKKSLAAVLCACALSTIACQPADKALSTQKSPNSGDGFEGSAAFRPPLVLRSINSLDLPPLTCANPGSCPAAIGELVTFTLKGTVNCTATLIDSDIILTASHCIPWENLAPDWTFSGNCWIRWPANPQAPKGEARVSQSVACKSLIAASELGPERRSHIYPDHALIRLSEAQIARRPLAVLPDETATASAPKTPDHAFFYGIKLGSAAHRIEFARCQRDELIKIPNVTYDSKNTIVFPSCPVYHGYSGGPILAPQGRKIIGVISGVVDFDPERPERPLISIGTKVAPLRPSPPNG